MEIWFSKTLIKWYLQNKRDLPWRNETDPYKIWLSEIILQQTQVAQGLAYYLRFIEQYPVVGKLAAAPEDEVLKLWQGLGYYSRARNLQASAKEIQSVYAGIFPKDYAAIRTLKGVGDYTAAAIASFAWDLPHAVVDGNVYRLLSRLFGIDSPIDSSSGKKEFAELATELLDKKRAGLHNQAIMEFGSQYCRPVNPDCDNCVFSRRCVAAATGRVQELPVKSKKTKVRDRYFSYLVIADKKGDILLKRRGPKDIWQGLYEFMLIESDTAMEENQLLKHPEFKTLAGKDYTLLHRSVSYRHLLSHQRLHARFYVILLKGVHAPGAFKSPLRQLEKFAFPRLIEKFMSDCRLKDLF